MTARYGGAIRPVRPADLPALRAVIEATALFPADLLDGMLAGHLSGEADEEIWLTDDADGPVAVAYCAPERMTQGTWNLYLIAVHPARQSEGRGAALIWEVERLVVARGAHQLLVETSGLPEFQRIRDFYPRCGFAAEALIRDFYRRGEDKVVFRKVLALADPASR